MILASIGDVGVIIIKMNLTRLNFKVCLPHLLEAIRSAHLVAIDLQMSGIMSDPESDPSFNDSLELRYWKVKSKIEKFIPVQLGICTARYEGHKIIYSPFNIYIYPLSLSERDAEQFAFNSQSMRFLSSNKFDFNKLFYEGVPFLNAEKVRRNQIRLETIQDRQKTLKHTLLNSPEVQAFLKLNTDRAIQWVKQIEQKNKGMQGGMKEMDQGEIKKIKEDKLIISIEHVKVKAYMALIHMIQQQFNNLKVEVDFTDANGDIVEDKQFLRRKFIRMSIVFPTDQPHQASAEQEQQEGQSLSLSQVLLEIGRNKKPLIVHNGYLDLMHIYHRFIDSLPITDAQYRANLHEYFPLIFDTKHICNSSPVILDKLGRDTSLGKCYKMLRELPRQQQESVMDEGCGGYGFDDENSHEAGFDALMTCFTFVNSMRLLNRDKQDFLNGHNLLVNKIPLGSIRVPYNLEQSEDLYSEMATCKYQFRLLQSQRGSSIWDEELVQELKNKWGSLKISRKAKDSQDFLISFIGEDDQRKFTHEVIDSDGHGLYKLENLKYLVLRIQSNSRGDLIQSNSRGDLIQSNSRSDLIV